jgi:hypothetical protein
MKKVIVILLGLALTIPAFTQEKSSADSSSSHYKQHTLFCHTALPHLPFGYFLGLSGSYTKFGNKDVFMPGISMGIILSHHWTIGMQANGIGNSRDLTYANVHYNETDSSWHSGKLGGGYGGALFEYTLFPKSVVHLSFPIIIGGGYMFYYKEDGHQHDNDKHHNNSWHMTTYSNDYFFTVEPGIRMEINLAQMLRLGIKVSYRYSPDFKLPNVSSDLLNQFNAGIDLRIGKF